MTEWISGYCPACGHDVLFVHAGHITCSLDFCPRPDAADVVLSDGETEHIVVLGESGFTVRHPLRERIGDALMDCRLHQEIAASPGPPAVPGRYRVKPGIEGWQWDAIAGEDSDE